MKVDETSLLTAAALGDLPTIIALINLGVDINCRDAIGRTPIMLAAIHGQTDTAEALMDLKADTTIFDKLGRKFDYYLQDAWTEEEIRSIEAAVLQGSSGNAKIKADQNKSGDSDEAIGL